MNSGLTQIKTMAMENQAEVVGDKEVKEEVDSMMANNATTKLRPQESLQTHHLPLWVTSRE